MLAQIKAQCLKFLIAALLRLIFGKDHRRFADDLKIKQDLLFIFNAYQIPIAQRVIQRQKHTGTTVVKTVKRTGMDQCFDQFAVDPTCHDPRHEIKIIQERAVFLTLRHQLLTDGVADSLDAV